MVGALRPERCHQSEDAWPLAPPRAGASTQEQGLGE